MALPFEYQNASLAFERFMIDSRDRASLGTTHMTWNMVVGVLRAFRRRLCVEEALRVAAVLPPARRAIFIEDSHPDEPPLKFGTFEEFLAEVRSARTAHNSSPPNAIAGVAAALRNHADVAGIEFALSTRPAGSREFWPGLPAQSVPVNAV